MKIFRSFNFFLIGLFFFSSGSDILAWVEPTTLPPDGNILAPLNTSFVGQSKTGGLILNLGNAAYGLIVKSGLVGVGTDNPRVELEVAGKIKATGLKINSTGRGVLLPRTTPDKVSNPTEGMMIYNTAQKKFYFFGQGIWKSIEEAVTDERKVIEYAHGEGGVDDYYCKKKNITADGRQEDWANINEGKICGDNDKICQTGECKELSCGVDFYKTGLVCSAVGAGYYSPIADNSRYACTNKPANSIYTGSGGGANNCPWSCNSGYVQSGNSCVIPISIKAVSGDCNSTCSAAGKLCLSAGSDGEATNGQATKYSIVSYTKNPSCTHECGVIPTAPPRANPRVWDCYTPDPNKCWKLSGAAGKNYECSVLYNCTPNCGSVITTGLICSTTQASWSCGSSVPAWNCRCQ